MRLVKLVAPAYWSRWQVRDGDRILGTVERRGGFAPWTVLVATPAHPGKDPEGPYTHRLVPGTHHKRADAVAALASLTGETR